MEPPASATTRSMPPRLIVSLCDDLHKRWCPSPSCHTCSVPQETQTTTDAETRNGWLRLDDAGLLAQCEEHGYRSSGPGGQRRNKVETAARVRHNSLDGLFAPATTR